MHRNYVIGEILGEGSFGVVRQAHRISSSREVCAVKIVKRCGERDDEWSEVAMTKKEALLLKLINHPYIIHFWGLYEGSEALYMVMDLCAGGEVFNKLLKVRRFTEEAAAHMSIQMLSAIEYLHQNNIMHRDIKAENFLLQNDSPSATVKLIDFGFATHFTKQQIFTQACGSLAYMAPELIKRRYSYSIDLWAFGVLAYLLLYGKYPYRSKEKQELHREIISKEPNWVKQGVGELSVDFIQQFLMTDPLNRVECTEGLLHPFLGLGSEPVSPVSAPGSSNDAQEVFAVVTNVGNASQNRTGQVALSAEAGQGWHLRAPRPKAKAGQQGPSTHLPSPTQNKSPKEGLGLMTKLRTQHEEPKRNKRKQRMAPLPAANFKTDAAMHSPLSTQEPASPECEPANLDGFLNPSPRISRQPR
eukprot:TRINITY_DN16665_c0_g1_i3.p1 TRINITY_DN16665_c0_g1~~TRINITY_DN16665_c0_g1_i3.p1  ORF type:complete len:472 (+),score=73.62 TRINITY_DN16665_c0_g1_i3:170-1417(+)